MSADPAAAAPSISRGALSLLNFCLRLLCRPPGILPALSRVRSTAVYDRLGELRDGGMVDSAALGWCRPLSMRWFMTDPGLSAIGKLGSTWHEEFTRCRLPGAPALGGVVLPCGLPGPGPGGLPVLPLAGPGEPRRRGALPVRRVALFWSGAFQSEEWIADRLGRLAPDLREMSVSHEPPGLACWSSW